MGDSVGVGGSQRRSEVSAAFDPGQREASEAVFVRYSEEVQHPGLERDVGRVPIGEAEAARIETDDSEAFAEACVNVALGEVPLELDVAGEEVREPEQWVTFAGSGVGDADAVRSGRELDAGNAHAAPDARMGVIPHPAMREAAHRAARIGYSAGRIARGVARLLLHAREP